MNEQISFEDALKKLKEIVEQLEKGNLPLEESMDKFNKGLKLCEYCTNKLKQAELIVKKVVEKDKKLVLEEFE